MAEKKGEKSEKKEEKKPEEKEEKEEAELPIVEYGVNFGGLFKGLGEFINSTMELAEKAQEMEKTGELRDKAGKLRGMYGVNVRVGRGGKPIIQEFGSSLAGIDLFSLLDFLLNLAYFSLGFSFSLLSPLFLL